MAGKGGLIIEAYTGRRAIPIENVSVTISDGNGNDKKVVAYRTTDRNGKTEKVEVETPDISESLTPFNGRGYTPVDVQLDHPLYYSVFVEQVQVFPDNNSLQQMEMVPLPENHDGDKNRIYVVTPQNL